MRKAREKEKNVRVPGKKDGKKGGRGAPKAGAEARIDFGAGSGCWFLSLAISTQKTSRSFPKTTLPGYPLPISSSNCSFVAPHNSWW